MNSIWGFAALGALIALAFLAPAGALASGTISGTIRVGKRPAALASVIVIGTRRGAQADEHGRFVLTEVPAGPQMLRTLMLGLQPVSTAVLVEDGKTVPVRIEIPPKIAPKNWRPPRPPPKEILRRMAEAPRVTLFRLTGRQRPGWSGALRIAAYDTLWSRPLGDRALVAQLIDLLRRRESFDNGGSWDVVKLCSPRPGVGVQFADAGDTMDVLLCYECAVLWVVGPVHQHFGGDFDRKGAEFVRWVKAAIPDDPAIRAIPEPARWSDRTGR